MYRLWRWIGNNVDVEQSIIVEDAKTMMLIIEDLPEDSSTWVVKGDKTIGWFHNRSTDALSPLSHKEDALKRNLLPWVHLKLAYSACDTKVLDKDLNCIHGIEKMELCYDANAESIAPLLKMYIFKKGKTDELTGANFNAKLLVSTICDYWTTETEVVYANIASIDYVDVPPIEVKEGWMTAEIYTGIVEHDNEKSYEEISKIK